MRKLLDANCSVGGFAVVRAGYMMEPPTVVAWAPDYSAAEAQGREAAAARPGRDIYLMQITGQLRAVPHVFEVHANEGPRPALASPR